MPKMQESPHVISRLRVGLGTFVAVDAEANSPVIAQRGIAAAFDAIATVERLMHPSRAGSELAALNACPPGMPLTVHAWTWEVLELCRRVHELSRGVFDPCLAAAAGRMQDLDLTQGQRVVPHAKLRIDLGGIAKGYAVDRAIDALRAAGCDGGLVNAGGDLAVFGIRHHQVVCREPCGAGAALNLHDAALATSDAASESRPPEHRGYYHGADRTVRVSGRATVTAARAAVADALTKCLLLGDCGSNQELLAAFGAKRIEY